MGSFQCVVDFSMMPLLFSSSPRNCTSHQVRYSGMLVICVIHFSKLSLRVCNNLIKRNLN